MSNSKVHNGLFVDYCAKDFLDGTQQLGPWEELAYRRVIDLIYATGDTLADDDKRLAWMTKTGSRWPAIKHALVEVYGKLEIIDGRISNRRCRDALTKTAQKIEQKREAGRASAAARKPMEKKESVATGVATDVITDVPTNHVPKNLSNKNPKSNPPVTVQKTLTAAPGVAAAGSFTGKTFSLNERDFAFFQAKYSAIPDFLTALQSFDEQLRGKPNVHAALHAKLLAKHEWYLRQRQQAAPPPKPPGRDFRTARHRAPVAKGDLL
jgi:uncharacterized protein YdaU (DUF1376 family)